MILFVFEGNEREPRLYRTLERLYFPRENDNIICSFGNNIYDLYNELLAYGEGGDIVSLMRDGWQMQVMPHWMAFAVRKFRKSFSSLIMTFRTRSFRWKRLTGG